MSGRHLRTILFGLIALALSVTPSVAGDVRVGVNISVPAPPPPPILLPAPPRVVVVPNSPVYYAPGVDFNLFVYGGRYYTFHHGSWFYATSHGGPWVFIAPERVPGPVVAVPAPYYKIPPGHAKRMGPPESPGHGSAAAGCPPGQAKKGRC
jgi:hypothetical protein